MTHPIHRVVSFARIAPFTLIVVFADGTTQEINFRDMLEGELYGPLQDPALFDQAQLDPEAHTLVWPNGADFDPATLHDWPDYAEDMRALAQQWTLATVAHG